MNQTFKEGNLDVRFSDWEKVIQFDKHIDYEKVKNIIPNTKGIDFVGIRNGKAFFLEMTDFRNHKEDKNIKIQLNDKGNELMIEVAEKVKSTLACVLAAARNSTNESDFWKSIISIIQDSKKDVSIILWIGIDDARINFSKAKAGIYTQTLKQKLSWLTSKVMVANQNEENNFGMKII
jgi:hypothetical protein